MTFRRAMVLLLALLALLVLAAPAASADVTTFSDTAGTGHEHAVASLAEKGIVQGCDADRFCSADELTRGQIATIVVRTLDLPAVPDEAGAQFSDIDGSSHSQSIDALAHAGLISGCGDGRFCPRDPITREQLASILQRAFEVPDAPEGVTYFDDLSETHAPAVGALAEAGIANGCTEQVTSFCARSSVERAHAAMFLGRTLDLVDRIELVPFDERQAEQARLDEQANEQLLKAEMVAAEEAPAEDARGEAAVEAAMAQLGKPYQWGGSGPSSFDCSGLTSFGWAAAGVTLPRTSSAQYSGTTRISRDELRPGDLVFYHSPISHVAMYIGDGRVVEAPNSGNNVRIREDGLTRSGVVGFGRP